MERMERRPPNFAGFAGPPPKSWNGSIVEREGVSIRDGCLRSGGMSGCLRRMFCGRRMTPLVKRGSRRMHRKQGRKMSGWSDHDGCQTSILSPNEYAIVISRTVRCYPCLNFNGSLHTLSFPAGIRGRSNSGCRVNDVKNGTQKLGLNIPSEVRKSFS